MNKINALVSLLCFNSISAFTPASMVGNIGNFSNYKNKDHPNKFFIPSSLGGRYSFIEDTVLPIEKSNTIKVDDDEMSIYDFICINCQDTLLDTFMRKQSRQSGMEKPSFKDSAVSQTISTSTPKKNSWRTIFQMTRPSNIISIIILHIFGVYNMLTCLNQPHKFRKMIFHPSIVLTLVIVLIISGTSMLVNDYYDAKLGTDTSAFQTLVAEQMIAMNHDTIGMKSDLHRLPSASLADINAMKQNGAKLPLVSGLVTLPAIKSVLHCLYALLLILSTALPGISTRMIVMVSSLTTFYYTKFIKPLTWWKNISCAAVMSLSPLTSAFAVFELCLPSLGFDHFPCGKMSELFMFTASLFCALIGREMIMDILDCESDTIAGIKTVPVAYGKKVAALSVSGFWAIAAMLNSLHLFTKRPSLWLRSSLSWLSSLWFVIRGVQVSSSIQSEDKTLLTGVIEESKMILILMMLGACI